MVLSTASLMHFSNKVYKIQKTSWNRTNHMLQTNGDHHSTQLDEISNMVLSTVSFMYFLNCFFQNQNKSWNRSNRKLQTKEDHHSTQLDEIWLMVLSTASFMHFLSKVYNVQKPHETGQVISYRQKRTTIRHISTRSDWWYYPQPHWYIFKHLFQFVLLCCDCLKLLWACRWFHQSDLAE